MQPSQRPKLPPIKPNIASPLGSSSRCWLKSELGLLQYTTVTVQVRKKRDCCSRHIVRNYRRGISWNKVFTKTLMCRTWLSSPWLNPRSRMSCKKCVNWVQGSCNSPEAQKGRSESLAVPMNASSRLVECWNQGHGMEGCMLRLGTFKTSDRRYACTHLDCGNVLCLSFRTGL